MEDAFKKLDQSLTLVKGSFRNVLSGERYNSVAHLADYSRNLEALDRDINIARCNNFLDAIKILKGVLPEGVIVLGYSIFGKSEYLVDIVNDEYYDTAIISPDLTKAVYINGSNEHTLVDDLNEYDLTSDRISRKEYVIAVVCEIKGNAYIYYFTQKDLDNGEEKNNNIHLEIDDEQDLLDVPHVNQKQESKIMSKVNQLVELNKSAAINAGKIEAGNIALDQLVKLASKAVPSGIVGTMVKPYIDTPYGRVVIANALAFAVQQYAPSNEKARLLVEATSNAALLELTQSLNLRKLIDELVDNPSIASVLDTLEKE